MDPWGGGITCLGTAPTILANRFLECLALSGGALYCADGASPLIKGNEFIDNIAEEFGGAVYSINSSPVFVQNRFEGNRANLGYSQSCQDGGAIYASEGTLVLEENYFGENSAPSGGAVYARECELISRRNIYERNRAYGCSADFSNGTGGAIRIGSGPSQIPMISIGDLFARNSVAGSEFDSGSGSAIYAREATVINGTFVSIQSEASVIRAFLGGSIDRSLFRSLEGEIHIVGPFTITYSNVHGGYIGEGNIDADPLFRDIENDDYRLLPESPCLDAGPPDVACSGLDLDRHPRTLDGDLDGDARVDMGAYEYSNADLMVSGSTSPGEVMTLTTVARPGLLAYLFLGTEEGDSCLSSFGSLLMDPSSVTHIVLWDVVPPVGELTLDVLIPPSLPIPSHFFLQELAIDAGSSAGNFSNLVELLFE